MNPLSSCWRAVLVALLTGCVAESAGAPASTREFPLCSALGEGFADCDGVRTQLACDPVHCGRCGRVCATEPGASGTCTRGSCDPTPCAGGFADCDRDPANGCETNVLRDPNHCGSCTTRCELCQFGRCAQPPAPVTCPTGYSECDGDRNTRCETDIRSDHENCGGCRVACAVDERCDDSVCLRTPCALGTADCDGRRANGCETRIDTRENCRRCGNACADGPHGTGVCDPSVGCGLACALGWGGCSGAFGECETSLRDNLAHCGGCGRGCGSAHATPSCVDGACRLECHAGFADCDRSASNGCESDTRESAVHCGGCSPCAPSMICHAGRCEGPPPRPLRPMTAARTTSMRPTLRWELLAGGESVRVELCADRACARVESAFDATGSSARPPTPLRPGLHFWRLWRRDATGAVGVPSPTWEFFSPAREARVETSSGAIPDVDGDGLADVLVHFGLTEGVFVWLSSRGGLAGDAPLHLLPPPGHFSLAPCVRHYYAGMGVGMFTAGDLDGDGMVDVWAPAPDSWGCAGATFTMSGYSFALRGRAGDAPAVIPGSDWWASGFLVEPWAVRSAYGEGAVGDADGEGRSEIAGYSYIFPRMSLRVGALFLAASNERPPSVTLRPTGNAVVPLGDVNGDGLGDVAISTRQMGTLRVISAGAALARTGAPGECVYAFGLRAHALGDVDGDGLADYDEIVDCVSARFDETLYQVEHRHNAAGAEVVRWTETATEAFVATPVRDEPGWIGDATGDGLDDVVRADRATRRLRLFAGTADGLSPEPIATAVYPTEADGEAEFARAF